MKTCYKCKIEKPYVDFSKDKRSKNGYQAKCKVCAKEYDVKNVDKIRQQKKQYYINNAEIFKLKANQNRLNNRLNNPELKKLNDKEYYILNRATLLEYHRKYYILNRTTILENVKQYQEQWYQTEEGKLFRKSCNHKYRSLLKANTPIGKDWKPEDIITKFKLQKGKCVYCETSIKDYYEIDHFVPVSKNGSNEPSNIQLLCKHCNGIGGKGRKDAHEFAQQHGKLF